MNSNTPSNLVRRRFLSVTIWFPIGLAVWMTSGCALPMLMKAQKKKISQDHFSCGENCPHAVRESHRER